MAQLSLSARYSVAKTAAKDAFGGRPPQLSLITDFGSGDEAVYAVKSAARSVNPRARIDDICHDVPLGNILLGAWRLRRAVALPTEPPRAAYVAVIDPGVGSERKNIAVRTRDGRYLVGPDNGVLSLAFTEAGVEMAVEIEDRDLTLLRLAHSRTFHGKDVFAPVAAHLLRGVPICEFGRELPEGGLARITISSGATESTRSGHLVDVDGFGSIRTNVPNHLPRRVLGKEVDFALVAAGRGLEGKARVVRTFSEAERGEAVFVLSSTGCLDLAVNLGSASEKFGIPPARIALDRSLRPDNRIEIDISR
jgi:S-adenosylmethionine hydrolase